MIDRQFLPRPFSHTAERWFDELSRQVDCPDAWGNRIARVGATIAAAIGLTTVLQWGFAQSIEPVGAAPTGAVSLLLLGTAVLLMTVSHAGAWTRGVAIAGGLVSGVIGLMSSLSTFVPTDISLRSPLSAIGGPSVSASIALCLIGITLLTKHNARGRFPGAGDVAALAGILIPFVAIVGYFYEAMPIGIFAGWLQVAPRMSAGLFALAIAAFALMPHGPISSRFASPGPGGLILTRLLPAYCAILLAAGWIRLEGQREGWYGLDIGVAGHVVVTIILFASATAWTARVLDRTAVLRDAAERALLASERGYHAIVDATFDGIVASENGVMYDVSDGFAAMFGYPPDQLRARPILDLVAPESRADVLARLYDGGEGLYEFVGCRKDGTRIVVEAVARIQLVDGRPVRVSALRDVTARRRVDLQVRQAQKMEAVGRLAGGVAHDFNNLLTVIAGHAQFVLDELTNAGRPTDDAQQILDAASSAAGLTHQLLAFSRQQPSEPVVLTLNDAVADAQKMLGRLLGEDIAVTVALAPDIRPIKADPTHIQQVIMNLAVNARDAMPQGGMLAFETSNVDVEEDAGLGTSYTQETPIVMPGTYAVISVSDTGLGMDAETRRRVFEPFFTTKAMGTGTGLGLATVYGIVKQSGGYIWVYSEPGHGTIFKVFFPTTGEHVGPDRTVPSRPCRSGTETVLLVEDSAQVRRISLTSLERAGYSVIEAADGNTALRLVEEHDGPIHLLISDVVLPGMSGRVLAERLLSTRPELKVLFVSGYTNDALVQHGLCDSGVALLQKPFTPDAIARRVREILDGCPGGQVSNPCLN